MTSQEKKLKQLQKKLEEMEKMERMLNYLEGKGNRPLYEENMELGYWRKKKQLKEKIKRLQEEKIT